MRTLVKTLFILALSTPTLAGTTSVSDPRNPAFTTDQELSFRIDASGHQIVLGSFVKGGIGEEKYESHALLNIKVIKTNVSSTTLRWTYDHLAIEFESPVDPRRFDSDQPIEQDKQGNKYSRAFSKVVRPVVGSPITVELNADREVVAVSGNSELMPTADPLHSGWLMPLIGTDGIKTMVNTLFVLGTDKNTLNNGDRWSKSVRSEAPMIGEMETKIDHKLLATTENEAIIATTSTLNVIADNKDSPLALVIDYQRNFSLLRWDLNADRAHSVETHSVFSSSLASGAGRFIVTFMQRISAVE